MQTTFLLHHTVSQQTITVVLLSFSRARRILIFVLKQKSRIKSDLRRVDNLIEDDQPNASMASTAMAATASAVHTIGPSTFTYCKQFFGRNFSRKRLFFLILAF